MDWHPLLLSIKLATLVTAILLPFMVLIAWWLSFGGPWKVVVRAILTLPMVLPPTVLGFYLLTLFSPNHFFGGFLEDVFGVRIVFSFTGILIASLVVAVPFFLNPLLAGFESLPKNLTDAARVLGKSRWVILWRVLLPNMVPSILTACVLAFAHAMGEFGVVLMIGGKIPGQTMVASMAVYDLVETMDYPGAFQYSLILSGTSFLVLTAMTYFERSRRNL